MFCSAVGFDYGGVIKGQPASSFISEVCKLLGVSKEEYHRAYFRHNKKINRSEVTWEQLWKLVLTDLGQPEKASKVKAISEVYFGGPINRNVLDLADRLRISGYKTGLLSNNTLAAAELMRNEGVDGHFDVMHVSAETGFVKPEPNAFAYFAEELGIKLTELIFIDDSEKSLSTAEACGFTPILYESYEKLIGRLRELGVKT